MITGIVIRDFVLIERLELALGEGLNVLTGGSGEGKTLVVQAVRFLFGGEGGGKAAAARLVRPGADEVVVEATLVVSDPLRAALTGVGVTLPPDLPLVRLRRGLDLAGRGRAQLEGLSGADGPWTLTVSALRAIGQSAVEVFGQGDAVDLALESRQRAALDAAAGLSTCVASGDLSTCVASGDLSTCVASGDLAAAAALYGERRERALGLARQVDLLEAEEERLRAEATRWREERDALADLDPKADELPQLVAQADGHAAREAAVGALDEVLALLVDDEEAALDRVRTARSRLERAAPSLCGGAEAPLGVLGEGLDLLADAAGAVRRLRDAAEGDAEEVARVRERIAEWRALARRLRIAPEALAARWADLREVEAPDDLAARREQVEAALVRLERELERDAAALTEGRAAAAPRLADGMTTTLPGLGLTGAFEVRVEAAATAPAAGPPGAGPAELRLLASHPAAHGRDRVVFWLAPGPSQPLAPLDRASGGELSRVFLALGLETARAGARAGGTLVFDEVDQNVGARLGGAIGACLAGIGAGRQVLAVTHLAPVAARAQRHVRLVKTDGRSRAEPLDEAGRVEELALMIRGSPVTAVARAQARELLEEAATQATQAKPTPATKRPQGRASARGKARRKSERVALAR